VIAAILKTEPGPLERTPGDLQRLVARALCKERDRRHQTMSDLGGELRRLRGRLEFEAQLAQLGLTRSGEEMASDRQAALFSLPPSAPAPEKRRARVRKAIDSLAVLPLANASPDPHMEYLSDGITESIINSLSQVPKLRVLPRGTVFRYRGLEVDPLAAGQELGVRAVLTGRVMQLGESLIIRAELIDVANEAQLWGGQYRRRLTDIFALEEEIAREISAQLRHKLSGEERRRIIRRQTESAEAYQLYLKGRYYTNKRTGEWIQKGIEHFEQAIAIDPNYALAYAGLADAYGLLASATGGWAPREAYPRAKAAAERALALDETLGEAHCALGFFRLLYDWDDASAEREFARALELSPNYANAHDGYGFYLKATGQHEASIRACERALALDPLSLFTNLSLGWAYYFARQYDRALQQGHKALELDPHFGFAHWHCGLNYQQLGKYEEAVTAMQQAVLLGDGGPSFVAHLGHACGRAGREGEAREVLANLSEMARARYVSSYFFALVHLGLGETAETLESLERAYDERAGFLAFLDVEPLMDPLREEPRFDALRARIRPAAV
jgi:serine/threonine-protein kinase